MCGIGVFGDAGVGRWVGEWVPCGCVHVCVRACVHVCVRACVRVWEMTEIRACGY